VTFEHLQPQQLAVVEGGEWEGFSDEDLPSPHEKTSGETPSLHHTGSDDNSGEECDRLIRLINAADGGDARAIDELIEALEVC
jgi:hypothetical protein